MFAFRRAVTLAAVAAGAAALAVLPAQAATDWPAARAAEVPEATLRLAAAPDQVADIANASKDNGAPAVQWGLTGAANQRWKVESSLDGFYRFTSVNSGKCLNVQNASGADGAAVIQYTCGTAPNELWKPVRKVIGYQLVNKNSGKCLNVKGGLGQGNPLVQYTCSANGAPNEVWLAVWEPPVG